MGQCRLCNAISNDISKELGVCSTCIREMPEKALPIAMQTHRKIRSTFGLPRKPPKASRGLPCNLCVNECRIPEHRMGSCGLRKNAGATSLTSFCQTCRSRPGHFPKDVFRLLKKMGLINVTVGNVHLS